MARVVQCIPKFPSCLYFELWSTCLQMFFCTSSRLLVAVLNCSRAADGQHYVKCQSAPPAGVGHGTGLATAHTCEINNTLHYDSVWMDAKLVLGCVQCIQSARPVRLSNNATLLVVCDFQSPAFPRSKNLSHNERPGSLPDPMDLSAQMGLQLGRVDVLIVCDPATRSWYAMFDSQNTTWIRIVPLDLRMVCGGEWSVVLHKM